MDGEYENPYFGERSKFYRGIHNKDEDLSIGSDFRPPKRNAARAVSGGSNQSSSRGPTIVGIR